MANKIFSSISILCAVALLAAIGRAPALAQTNEPPAGVPDVQRRCTTVALTSNSPMLSVRLVEPYLQRRADFQASKVTLTAESKSADAIVTLTPSGGRNTHIEVLSRITGWHVSALSLWADYPGMVAADVMEQLKVVCALPITRSAQQSAEAKSSKADPNAGQDEIDSVVARDNHRQGFKHFAGRVGKVLVDFEANNATSEPITNQSQSKDVVAAESHSCGFKHFVDRVGFYTGVVLVDAAIVTGYGLAGAAMAAN